MLRLSDLETSIPSVLWGSTLTSTTKVLNTQNRVSKRYSMWIMPLRNATFTAAVRSFTSKLRENVLYVHGNGVVAEAENGSDLLVPLTEGDELEHLNLPRRQCWIRGTLIEPGSHVGSHRMSPGVHFPHDTDQVVGEGVLQQVGRGARGQRAMNVLIALIHRQHDDARVRIVAPDLLDRVDTVCVRRDEDPSG